MSAADRALTTWEQFLELPDPEPGFHLELHDGDVVLAAAARPSDIFVQMLLARWLTLAAEGRGYGAQEFPYRPAQDQQFWKADIAYVPNEATKAMRGAEYPIYAPPLIVEVLSPLNRRAKIDAQRVAAFAAGTQEFWIIDTGARTVRVFWMNGEERVYGVGDEVVVSALGGAGLAVAELFVD